MGKLQISNDLQKRRTSRSLLAVSLAASLAAFGCTTNLNPGNGTPTRTGPELRSSPTSGISTGTERVTPPPQPMTSSSYNSAQVLPPVTPRTVNRGITRRSPAEAAAIMAGAQALRGRYLGVVNPGPGNRPYVSDHAGGLGNPAMLTNPQMTINSTITSPAPGSIDSAAFPVTTGGAGILGTGVAGGTTTGTIGGTTTLNGTAASTFAGTTATGAGVGLPAGTLATVRPAVTETIGNNPGVTSASVGAGRAGVPIPGRTTTTTAATTGTTTTTAAATGTTVTAASSATPSVTGGVRVVRGNAGAVTITNATATSSTTGSNQQ
jgi:hypothetical protein